MLCVCYFSRPNLNNFTTNKHETFGKVLSVTVRQKPSEGGTSKSWALATFVHRTSAKDAINQGELTVGVGEGQFAEILIKSANVDKELRKGSTGALAATWSSQEAKVAAAVSIQRMVRRSRKRQEKRGKPMRRRSSVKE